jgi:hypothetical protein
MSGSFLLLFFQAYNGLEGQLKFDASQKDLDF